MGYAEIRITAICPTGVGNPVSPGSTYCETAYSPPPSACSAYLNNVIVIDSIQCFPCGGPDMPEAYKSILVQ
jgi:hypothetical protein